MIRRLLNLLWKRPTRRIKIIWHWLPIIWYDQDWDYGFTLIALHHKIRRTRLSIQRNAIISDYKKICKEMLVAESLLKRFMEGDYDLSKLDPELCTCPENIMTIGERGQCIFHTCDYCRKFGMKKIRDTEQRHWEYMWQHISKNMQRWWD